MRRWTLLFVCLAGVLAAAGPHGQTIGARALTIVPDSANATPIGARSSIAWCVATSCACGSNAATRS